MSLLGRLRRLFSPGPTVPAAASADSGPAEPPGPPDAPSAPAPTLAVDPAGRRIEVRADGTAVGHDMLGNAVGAHSSVTHSVTNQFFGVQAPVPSSRRSAERRSVAGPVGVRELRSALGRWRPGTALPEPLSRADLARWRKELDLDLGGAGGPADGMRYAVEALEECVSAADLLSEVFHRELTSELLHRAARLAGLTGLEWGRDPLQDLLENAAFEAQPLTPAPPAVLLPRVTAAVAHCAGSEAVDDRLREWAAVRSQDVQLNDALKEFGRPEPDLRLVVSLADVRAGSPGHAEYWLVRGDRATAGEPLPVTHDLPSVVAAVGAALHWARDRLLDGDAALGGEATLDRIDIAAPASLLAHLMDRPWPLEESSAGVFRLGAHHSLMMRWSGRLGPDPSVPHATDPAELNDAARKSLREMGNRSSRSPGSTGTPCGPRPSSGCAPG